MDQLCNEFDDENESDLDIYSNQVSFRETKETVKKSKLPEENKFTKSQLENIKEDDMKSENVSLRQKDEDDTSRTNRS